MVGLSTCRAAGLNQIAQRFYFGPVREVSGAGVDAHVLGRLGGLLDQPDDKHNDLSLAPTGTDSGQQPKITARSSSEANAPLNRYVMAVGGPSTNSVIKAWSNKIKATVLELAIQEK